MSFLPVGEGHFDDGSDPWVLGTGSTSRALDLEGIMEEINREITDLLLAWSDGDDQALCRLVPLVYGELHRRAASRLRREAPGSTLQATALVHEVYLRLIDQSRVSWRSRAHFFSIAALMMRRIVIDHARRRKYAKRGGDAVKISLEDTPPLVGDSPRDLLAVDQALHELARQDVELARVVELRFFGGLTHREIGAVLDLSVPTITRRWRLARAWLYRYLTDGDAQGLQGSALPGAAP